MATGRDIATRILRQSAIVGRHETPTAAEINDTVAAVNDMLDSWSNDSLVLFARAWETFPLSSGVTQYNIGVGQTFNTVRPLSILQAQVKLAGSSMGYELAVLNDISYNQNTLDVLSSGIPAFLNYDGSNPVGIIRVFPQPESGYNLFLLNEKPLLSIGLNDDFEMPPGWRRALVYNGAMEIAAEYGVQVPPQTAQIAGASLALLKENMAKRQNMDLYPSIANGHFNIYRGW